MEDLRTPCSRCGHGNPPENRFCGACGAPLTAVTQLARRGESSPVAASRAPLLPAELKPAGKALAVGLAALAARAGLAWLRRRAEGPGRPSLPAVKRTGSPDPVFQSFEELHSWVREGEFESWIFAQRSITSVRTGDRKGNP